MEKNPIYRFWGFFQAEIVIDIASYSNNAETYDTSQVFVSIVENTKPLHDFSMMLTGIHHTFHLSNH